MLIEQLLRSIGRTAAGPIFTWMGQLFGTGAVGGSLVTVAYASGVNVPIDASAGIVSIVAITDGVAFTIATPVNPPAAGYTQELAITIKNTSGGALGVGTFAAGYLMATNTVPAIANGNNRTFTFYWNGTAWVQKSSTSDVSN